MASGNGGNGTSAFPIFAPQIVEEPKIGFVPQQPRLLATELFGYQRIFINATQYHCHVQQVVGADEEARQWIVVLAQQLDEFSHQTEERELELLQQLSNGVNVSGVQQLLAKVETEMQRESTQFTTNLFGHVEKQLKEVGQTIAAFGDKIHYTKNVTLHDVEQANRELLVQINQEQQKAQAICTETQTQLELEGDTEESGGSEDSSIRRSLGGQNE